MNFRKEDTNTMNIQEVRKKEQTAFELFGGGKPIEVVIVGLKNSFYRSLKKVDLFHIIKIF